MHQTMQTLASAFAAALKRGIDMNDLSLHAIDYAHFQGNALFHASVTDFDGIAQLTWSYDGQGGRKQESRQLGLEDLGILWNGLVDSAVFKRCLVQDAGVEIDPFGFHVIGFASQEGALPTIGVFQVPVDEDGPEFGAWLRLLQPPAAFQFNG